MYNNIDECVNCGGIRVAGSTLCADCLAAAYTLLKTGMEDIVKAVEIESANAAVIISEKNAEIEDLKYQLRLHKRLISHIFREYQAVRGIKAVDVIA